MAILLTKEEFYLALLELRERLGRIEQALIELKPCECEDEIDNSHTGGVISHNNFTNSVKPKEVKKVIPLKKK